MSSVGVPTLYTYPIPTDDEIRSIIKGDWKAIALFGSCALGTTDEYSDIDVLQIAPNDSYKKSYSVGKINVTCISQDSLVVMVRDGVPLIDHLIKHMRIIDDPYRIFESVFSKFKGPEVSPTYIGQLYYDTISLGQTSKLKYFLFYRSLNMKAASLLSQAAYARAIHDKRLVWGLKALASEYNDLTILSGRKLKAGGRNYLAFKDVLATAKIILSSLPKAHIRSPSTYTYI